MTRKSKTTLAEKINARVEGVTPYERFTNLFHQLVPPERGGPVVDIISDDEVPAALKKRNHKKSTE